MKKLSVIGFCMVVMRFILTITLIVCILIATGCKGKNNDDSYKANKNSEIITEPNRVHSIENAIYRIENLNKEEIAFFKQISKENEFVIIPDRVERYFGIKEGIPLVNRLIYTNDFLTDKGYLYLELEFYGKYQTLTSTINIARANLL